MELASLFAMMAAAMEFIDDAVPIAKLGLNDGSSAGSSSWFFGFIWLLGLVVWTTLALRGKRTTNA